MDIFREMNPDYDSDDAKDTTLRTVADGAEAGKAGGWEDQLTLEDFGLGQTKKEAPDEDIFDEE